MLYFAETLALACLENAVRRSQMELVNSNFSKITVEAPDSFLDVDINNLPVGWDDKTMKGKNLSQQVGDNWIHSNSSLILRVPSVILPGDGNNFLVNPNHSDFNLLKILDSSPFEFDPRIKL
jgi:RES domain-containing protein